MGRSTRGSAPLTKPPSSSTWPSAVQYITSLVWGDDVKKNKAVYAKYKVSKQGMEVIGNPSVVKKTVRWHLIDDPSHPAHGENGLFASRKLSPGEHIVDYLGYVSLSGNENQKSDYSASFGDDHELALDANSNGNEARMCNDFRNTGRKANAVFEQYRDRAGDLKLAIFVDKKPISKGDEVLVSYGKGFWVDRVGDVGAMRNETYGND